MGELFINVARQFIRGLQNDNTENYTELIRNNPIIVTTLNITNTSGLAELRRLIKTSNLQDENILNLIKEWEQNDLLTKEIFKIFEKFDAKFNRIYLFKNNKAFLNIDEEPEIENFLKTRFDVLKYSGYPYYCPEGWRRYSLQIQDFDEKYKDWPVAYHGTASENLINILEIGFRISKGRGYACFGDGIYFSPSIEYCGHWRYARPKKSVTRQFYLQSVFQCRLRPGSFSVHRETLILDDKKEKKSQDPNIDRDKIIDPNFKNSELEWLISSKTLEKLGGEKKDAFIIYGLMVRVTKEHPKNLKINKWWNYYYDIPREIDQ